MSILKPVEKQRVAEEIVEQLRSLILTGQYPPGSKLPPERDLSKRLGVNRASLREALKKLEHLGLVRLRALADKADAAATPTELFETDFEFYVALTQVAGNARLRGPLLLEIGESFQVRMTRAEVVVEVATRVVEVVRGAHGESEMVIAFAEADRAKLGPLLG